MTNPMKNTKAKIILSSFLITLVFFSLNILQKNNQDNKSYLRALLKQEDVYDICNKSDTRLIKQYSNKYETEHNYTGLTKYESELVDVIKNKNFLDFKSYKSYGKYLMLRFGLIVILDIIFIFLWITYIGCCCRPRCCCKSQKRVGCCGECSYGISILFSFLVIVGGIAGLVVGRTIKKDANTFSCSIFKIFSHISYGLEEEEYTDLVKWQGFNKIEKMLNKSKDYAEELVENKQKMDNLTINCNEDSTYSSACDTYKRGKEKLDDFNNSINFLSAIDSVNTSLNNFNSMFSDVEDKYLDKLYDYLNKYVNKYAQLGYIILYGLMIVLGLLSLLCIAIYVRTCKCIKCVYVIVWNIEMIFMIVIIIIGVVFGMTGLFGSNAIDIIQYTISEDNINSTEPFLLNKYPDVIPYINICFIGDGNLKDQLNLSNSSFTSLDDLYQLKENINSASEVINQIPNPDDDEELQKLKNGFSYLENVLNIIEKLFGEIITNNSTLGFANCEFLKSDVDIFTDELNKSLIKTLKLFAIIIIAAGYCIGISVMFGIVVINRYNIIKKKKKKENVDVEEFSDIKIAPETGAGSKEKMKKITEKNFD